MATEQVTPGVIVLIDFLLMVQNVVDGEIPARLAPDVDELCGIANFGEVNISPTEYARSIAFSGHVVKLAD